MEKRIYLNNLYDYYKGLFTPKQCSYFEDYYYNNLSLSEIAENNGISRNAVHNQLGIVEEKLEYYEKTLGLLRKKDEILNILSTEVSNDILDEIIEIL